ncbi:hypothetical protein CWE11_06000 [Aliidiomarina sanyensis]|uniref:Pirin C-terminal domain-containing protein n=2 Tax=Aliidiomarina sanyensis TaxID=1249555 RepID=A0A432WKQ2_9GAMM|nr:hypothetical protein CWE11_06000 [Aliidiomarina sanyensis]
MAQLWVNLPAHAKSTPATYQSLTSDAMPKQPLGNGHSTFRVIAGEYEGTVGPAKTHSDLLVMDLELHANEKHVLHFNPNWNVWLTLLTGTALVNGQEIVRDASIVSFQQDGEAVHIEANNTARFLVAAGAPINEPVVGYGPFVMNSWNEIKEAIAQFS